MAFKKNDQNSWSLINKKAYEKKGKAYDLVRPLKLYGYLSKYFKKTLSRYLSKSKSSRIIDAGCGTGNSTYFLDKCVLNCEIKGIDQAKKMLDVAKQKKFRNKVSFEQISIEELSSENKYDAIQFFQVIHHFKDIRVVLSASERVLKKDGVIFFIDFFSRNPFVKFLNFIYCNFLGQGKYYSRDFNLAKTQLKKNGYSVLEIKTHPVFMNYSLIVAKKIN